MKSQDELFINFEQRKMIYFNKNKFIGWKKDFYDSMMIKFSKKHQVAFVQTYDKFLNINKFENKKFVQIYQMKWNLTSDIIRSFIS